MLALHQECQPESKEGDALHELREVVETELGLVQKRLQDAGKRNRIFFDTAVSQIETQSDGRKLLKLVCRRHRPINAIP